MAVVSASEDAGPEHDIVRRDVLQAQPLQQLCGQHVTGEIERTGSAERGTRHRVHVACDDRGVASREMVDRGALGDDAPEQAVAVLD